MHQIRGNMGKMDQTNLIFIWFVYGLVSRF